jgi:hypothetical protein
MSKIPTADKLFIEEYKKLVATNKNFYGDIDEESLEFAVKIANIHALNHVQAALEAAANKANLLVSNRLNSHTQSYVTVYNEEGPDETCTVNKDSILNAYPSSLIQ